MASNFVNPGKIIQLTAPSGGTTSGLGYLIGVLFGVALTTQVAGAACEFGVAGVFDLVKHTGEAWTEGEAIYWDAMNNRCTSTSTSNTLIGVAARLGGELSAAAIGRVKLTQAGV